jgi:4'-phosphopantetheinyl transferase
MASIPGSNDPPFPRIDRWTASAEPPPLAPNGLHLWRIELDAPEPSLRPLLAEDELQRADRLANESHRNRFIRARGALRTILGRYLDRPAAVLEFEYGEHGKPTLRKGGDLAFNLSHAEDLALLAIARAPVGVDLEPLQARGDLHRVSERMFPAMTLKELHGLKGEDFTRNFFRHWTALEARAKRHGGGIFNPADPAEPCRVTHFLPRPGWLACIAASPESVAINAWEILGFAG